MAVALTATLTITLGLAIATHQYLEHRVKGALTDIHTNDTLFDATTYGHVINYDKHSLILHGQRTLILSGEFHYWRLPDRTRWKPILEQYRSAGLNCVRIYFHWGFHSPQQGQYVFEGNRDIDYLLGLCEDIGLYVLAAPGPYICAETQAGGFPIWLVAKREIRLRHMKTNFWKEYDPAFMEYCVEYFKHILPILARHQITNAANEDGLASMHSRHGGCVIGLQIENEAFQHVVGYPIGLHDDMKVLAKTARDCRITVPLFTNDGFEQGSFIVKDDPHRKKKDFGIDLYGFDKYVVFTPNSEPTSWVVGRDPSFLEEWDPATVVSELDEMEKKVRAFGNANKRTPIFIPELQGGWFNHYGIQYTYDAIYRFYGAQYTRLMLDTVFSQGCTMLNFYMFYGGTNWGTVGDPDVYTSYDYSACIREYGLMSGRLRKLRQGILFLQSFSNIMVQTDAVQSSIDFCIGSDRDQTICQQRVSHVTNRNGPVRLTFIRNFSKEKSDRFDLHVLSQEAHRGTSRSVRARLSCSLPYKSSFIALGNYAAVIDPEIHLLFSATPIHVRGFPSDGKKEVWIASLAQSGPTEMVFSANVTLREAGGLMAAGTKAIQLIESPGDRSIKVLSIPQGAKNAHVTLSSSAKSRPPDAALNIIFLDQVALSTLYCYYETQTKSNVKDMPSTPKVVSWGSYNALYNPKGRTLIVETTTSQKELHVLVFDQGSSSPPQIAPSAEEASSTYGSELPHQVFNLRANRTAVLTQQLALEWIHQNKHGIPFSQWGTRATDFSTYNWKDCPRKSPSSNAFQKVSLDFLYTSGHIIYRGAFKTHERQTNEETGLLLQPNKSSVTLNINMRNRAIIFVNGICIGSHMTYSRQLLAPGAKMGYDPVSFGSHTFLITQEALQAAKTPHPSSGGSQEQDHEIIIVIDSFGLSRQPFVVDDIRNPRGLLSARVQGKDVIKRSERWQVAGVDVTKLDMAYGSTGFPDEHSDQGWSRSFSRCGPFVAPDSGMIWWRTTFGGPPSSLSSSPADPSINIPLCCRLEGEFSAMIILNNVLVGRYFGSDSPQHDFYLMDGLVHKAESGKANELKIMIYGDKGTVEDDNKVHVRVLPWIVEDATGELGQWSGNAAFSVQGEHAKTLGAGPFWTLKQTIVL
ncbi:hypothetical protein EDD11_007748 [Mortierella claussenii]|nr:hypothetical protein EDD11_007748 [Mortierella claussenii]